MLYKNKTRYSLDIYYCCVVVSEAIWAPNSHKEHQFVQVWAYDNYIGFPQIFLAAPLYNNSFFFVWRFEPLSCLWHYSACTQWPRFAPILVQSYGTLLACTSHLQPVQDELLSPPHLCILLTKSAPMSNIFSLWPARRENTHTTLWKILALRKSILITFLESTKWNIFHVSLSHFSGKTIKKSNLPKK